VLILPPKLTLGMHWYVRVCSNASVMSGASTASAMRRGREVQLGQLREAYNLLYTKARVAARVKPRSTFGCSPHAGLTTSHPCVLLPGGALRSTASGAAVPARSCRAPIRTGSEARAGLTAPSCRRCFWTSLPAAPSSSSPAGCWQTMAC
jgi:hypothetical protein